MSCFAAVEGCTIQILPPVTGGTVTVQTPASVKVKAGGKGVYSGDVTVIVAGTTLGALSQVNPATITISPKMVKKCKADGKLILGVGDGGQTTAPVAFSAGTANSTAVIAVQIVDAGQTKMMVA